MHRGGLRRTLTARARPDTGKVLTATSCQTGTASPRLRLLPAGRADTACSTLTLVPDDDGTWSLATAGSTQTVRLLIP